MHTITFHTAYKDRLVRYFASEDSLYRLHKGGNFDGRKIGLRQPPQGFPTDASGQAMTIASLLSYEVRFDPSDNPAIITEQKKLEGIVMALIMQWDQQHRTKRTA